MRRIIVLAGILVVAAVLAAVPVAAFAIAVAATAPEYMARTTVKSAVLLAGILTTVLLWAYLDSFRRLPDHSDTEWQVAQPVLRRRRRLIAIGLVIVWGEMIFAFFRE